MTLGTRTFTERDQTEFAALSGDWNPIHVDPIAARRLLFGVQVVHGVHLVCEAIDRAAQAGHLPRPVASLKAQFQRPVLIDRAAVFSLEDRQDGLRLVVEADGLRAALIDLGFGDAMPEVAMQDMGQDQDAPVLRALEDSDHADGEIPLAFPTAAFDARFPAFRAAVGSGMAAAVLASTRLVGMICPGLNSIYHDLRLVAQPGATQSDCLTWRVASVRAPLKMIEMAVDAGQITGEIRAFFRPEATAQLTMKEAREIVGDADLTGRHALVVGGSRGLGEVAAKLYAAAGAEVTVSYARGAEDAQRVADEIAAAGGRCHAVHLDVLDPALAPPDSGFTDMAYFASPKISARQGDRFDTALFGTFTEYFVTAFHRLCASLPGPVSVFYPSTIFLSDYERNFKEYVAAKGAGEALAHQVAQDLPGRVVHVARLPRMHTDQTAVLHGAQGAAPGPVLWPHLRQAAAT